MQSISDLGQQPAKARRAATKTPSEPAAKNWRAGKQSTVKLILVSAALLVAGMVFGGLAVRQRYKSKDSEVIAAVNGVTLHKDQFMHRLEHAAGAQVMRQMVGEELQLQYARKMGLYPTDAEVEAKYRAASKQPGFAMNLASSGQTPDDVKRSIRVSLAQEKVVGRGVTVTDEDIRKFYQANSDPKNPNARYYTPEMAQIAVIVTKSEADGKRALDQIHNGVPWATVVRTNSVDQSKDQDGMLPDVYRGRTPANRVPALEEFVFSLKVGDLVGPRRFAGVWWVIHCIDKKPASSKSFDTVKDECRQGALLTKGLPANAKGVQKGFEEFQKSANIQAFWTEYSEAIRTR